MRVKTVIKHTDTCYHYNSWACSRFYSFPIIIVSQLLMLTLDDKNKFYAVLFEREILLLFPVLLLLKSFVDALGNYINGFIIGSAQQVSAPFARRFFRELF